MFKGICLEQFEGLHFYLETKCTKKSKENGVLVFGID